MKNYAGVYDADDAIAAELEEAGIDVVRMPEIFRENHPEMRTVVIGSLGPWHFRRNWYYWIAEGPGLPVDITNALYATHRKVLRQQGDCTCRQWYPGFGCGLYHVDTQEGLNTLAARIRAIIDANGAEVCVET